MPIEVRWDNPNRTVIAKQFTAEWTWVEFSRITEEWTHYMMQSAPHVVHVIVDISTASATPMGGALNHLHHALLAYAENWGIVVFVNTTPFITILIDLFKRIHPEYTERVFVVAERHEAYTIIEQVEGILSPHLSEVPLQ